LKRLFYGAASGFASFTDAPGATVSNYFVPKIISISLHALHMKLSKPKFYILKILQVRIFLKNKCESSDVGNHTEQSTWTRTIFFAWSAEIGHHRLFEEESKSTDQIGFH